MSASQASLLVGSPRWWRLDPASQVEFQWGSNMDEDSFLADPPRRVVSIRTCISLRPYRDIVWEGQKQREYGKWQIFPAYKNEDGIYGRTTIVDGVPIVVVRLLGPPTIGKWTPLTEDETRELDA